MQAHQRQNRHVNRKCAQRLDRLYGRHHQSRSIGLLQLHHHEHIHGQQEDKSDDGRDDAFVPVDRLLPDRRDLDHLLHAAALIIRIEAAGADEQQGQGEDRRQHRPLAREQDGLIHGRIDKRDGRVFLHRRILRQDRFKHRFSRQLGLYPILAALALFPGDLPALFFLSHAVQLCLQLGHPLLLAFDEADLFLIERTSQDLHILHHRQLLRRPIDRRVCPLIRIQADHGDHQYDPFLHPQDLIPFLMEQRSTQTALPSSCVRHADDAVSRRPALIQKDAAEDEHREDEQHEYRDQDMQGDGMLSDIDVQVKLKQLLCLQDEGEIQILEQDERPQRVNACPQQMLDEHECGGDAQDQRLMIEADRQGEHQQAQT